MDVRGERAASPVTYDQEVLGSRIHYRREPVLSSGGYRARNPAAAAAKSAGRRSRPAPGEYNSYKRGKGGL